MRNLYNLANTWSWMCVLLVMICKETRTGVPPGLHNIKVDPQVSLVETRMVTQEQPGQADSRRLILYKGSRSQDRPAIGRCKSLLLWSQVELKSIHFHHAKVRGTFWGMWRLNANRETVLRASSCQAWTIGTRPGDGFLRSEGTTTTSRNEWVYEVLFNILYMNICFQSQAS